MTLHKHSPVFPAMVLIAALFNATPAGALVNDANDDTANPDCNLNYNDPDCWDLLVIPTNSGSTEYRVIINDAMPLVLNIDPLINSLIINTGANFSIANARMLTLLGDTGGGDRGILDIQGRLGLDGTFNQTRLRFDGGTVTGTGGGILEGSDSTQNRIEGINGAVFDIQNLELRGAFTLNVDTILRQAASMTADGSNPLVIQAPNFFDNAGATVAVNSGATLTIQSTNFDNEPAGTPQPGELINDQGTLNIASSSVTGGTINNSGALNISNGSTVDGVVINNLDLAAVLNLLGSGNRLENTTVNNRGEVLHANGSSTTLVDGLVIDNLDSGQVVLNSLGLQTILKIEGDGTGTGVTIRNQNAVPAGQNTIVSSTNTNNIIEGTGTLPKFTYDRQRVVQTGITRNIDHMVINATEMAPNPGTTYTYDNNRLLEATNSELSAAGTGTRLLLKRGEFDGTGTSRLVAGVDGTIEQNAVFLRLFDYSVQGRVRNLGAAVTDSTVDIASGGIWEYNSSGNRLERTTVDNRGEVLHANGSSTTLVDGLVIDNLDDGQVRMNSQGLQTILKIEGDGSGTGVTIRNQNAVPVGVITFGSSTNSNNIIEGTGTLPVLNLDNQKVEFTGNIRNLEKFDFFNGNLRPNPGTRLVFNNVNLEVGISSMQTTGAGTILRFENSNLLGAGADITAGSGGKVEVIGSNISLFGVLAAEGGVAEFRDTKIGSTQIDTDGTGLVRLLGGNELLLGAALTGNIEVSQAFSIRGGDVTYEQLRTNPSLGTTISFSEGAGVTAPILFSDRSDNVLQTTDATPFQITGRIEGAANLASPFLIEGGGEVNANASNPIIFSASGSVNNGLAQATDGGLLRVDQDVSGTGQWRAAGTGSEIRVGSGRNIEGESLEIGDGATFNLMGGQSTTDRILAEVGAKLVIASVLSTEELSFAMTDESGWNLSPTTIIEMTGGEGAAVGDWGLWGQLEVGGLDLGLDAFTHAGDPQGFIDNFSIPTLEIGAGSRVFLEDLFDNGNRGGVGGLAEALYVENLVFQDASALLNLNGLNLYYGSLSGDLGQIINADVVPVPPAVWLFGSGLLGLIGIARRKKAV